MTYSGNYSVIKRVSKNGRSFDDAVADSVHSYDSI